MSARRGFALAETDLRSFDRSETAQCHVQKPDRYRLIEALPGDVQRITRGSGVSYIGASFAGDCVVQDLSAFNRLLDFDSERGLLTVEAGARISVGLSPVPFPQGVDTLADLARANQFAARAARAAT